MLLHQPTAESAPRAVCFRLSRPFGRGRLCGELWFHEQGDRSWLVVTRDTVTHAVIEVALASDVAKAAKRKTTRKTATKKAGAKKTDAKKTAIKRNAK